MKIRNGDYGVVIDYFSDITVKPNCNEGERLVLFNKEVFTNFLPKLKTDSDLFHGIIYARKLLQDLYKTEKKSHLHPLIDSIEAPLIIKQERIFEKEIENQKNNLTSYFTYEVFDHSIVIDPIEAVKTLNEQWKYWGSNISEMKDIQIFNLTAIKYLKRIKKKSKQEIKIFNGLKCIKEINEWNIEYIKEILYYIRGMNNKLQPDIGFNTSNIIEDKPSLEFSFIKPLYKKEFLADENRLIEEGYILGEKKRGDKIKLIAFAVIIWAKGMIKNNDSKGKKISFNSWLKYLSKKYKVSLDDMSKPSKYKPILGKDFENLKQYSPFWLVNSLPNSPNFP